MTDDEGLDPMTSQACENTDREIWRGPDEGNGSYYADSLFITEHGALGINCGGIVRVRLIRGWHKLAEGPLVYDKASRTIKTASPRPDSNPLAPFAAELARQERVRTYRDGDCQLVDCRLTIGDLRRLAAEHDRLNEEIESLNNIISGYVDAIGRSA